MKGLANEPCTLQPFMAQVNEMMVSVDSAANKLVLLRSSSQNLLGQLTGLFPDCLVARTTTRY